MAVTVAAAWVGSSRSIRASTAVPAGRASVSRVASPVERARREKASSAAPSPVGSSVCGVSATSWAFTPASQSSSASLLESVTGMLSVLHTALVPPPALTAVTVSACREPSPERSARTW